MAIVERDNTGNQITFDYDLSKIFVFDNEYKSAIFINGTGADLELKGGEVLGRISSGGDAGKVTVLTSAATDGSQFPVGVNAQPITVVDGDEVEVYFCNSGDVVSGKVIYQDTDDKNTVIDGRSLEDRIASDTKGIQLIDSTELTNFDN